MRLIVIGGGGFIGRSFVRAATAAGHEVLVVARGPVPALEVTAGVSVEPGGLDALLDRPERLAAADAVCQFASTTIPGSSNADPAGDVRDNLLPNIALLAAMRSVGARRLLFLSSGGAIYGRPDRSPSPESQPQRPISSYGIVKGAVERYIDMERDLHGLSPVVVRPANPFGPEQSASRQVGIVAALLAAVRDGGSATIFGDGSIVRDFVYIDDLTRLLLRVLENGLTGTFNCGSGVGISLNEVVDVVQRVTGVNLPRRTMPARAFDPPEIVLDITRACAELGWTPQVSLEEGVVRTWAWMQEKRM